jgi:hypothetical protein
MVILSMIILKFECLSKVDTLEIYVPLKVYTHKTIPVSMEYIGGEIAFRRRKGETESHGGTGCYKSSRARGR